MKFFRSQIELETMPLPILIYSNKFEITSSFLEATIDRSKTSIRN